MAEGHRQRMRNRFYKEGIDHFEPHEVLEMILYFTIPRKDTNPMAHMLIEKFGSFHGVLEANREELFKAGLTENTVALLNMVPAFSNYYMQSHTKGATHLPDFISAGTYAVNKIGERTNEVFAVICLDIHRKILNFEILGEGTVTSASVPPRKIAECALRNNATKIILVHNHPGGSLIPSAEDIALTSSLRNMLTPFNVGIVDHIIVANGHFTSMSGQNLL
ncbi:MAG: hypothetical protein IKU60_05125 [Clostridia bacterium]|nr:hypothetical protein [Clostridia bacterium]